MLRTFTLLLPLLAFARAASVMSLNGDGWTLTSPQYPRVSVPATVPSQQYLDLMKANAITDPLYGLGELDTSWVGFSNWTYTSDVITDLDMSGEFDTYLVFEGLDTFTSIEFAGKHIGNTANQFRQHIFDVTDVLKPGKGYPRAALNFGPAENITHELSHSGDKVVNAANHCDDDHAYSCKIYARKEQSDFGWDWGAHLTPAGPWQGISIVQLENSPAKSDIYINNALVDIYRQGQMPNLPPDQSQHWVLNASLDYIGSIKDSAALQLELTDMDGRLIYSSTLDHVHQRGQTITGHTIIPSSAVETWWPNEFGPRPLYNAQIKVVPERPNPVVDYIASITRKVGFRTIVLNLNNITAEEMAEGWAPGSHWHFEINGLPFYAKGANFIPPDTFWPRVNATHMRQLFELCADSHYNMLRVWSSGAYLYDWIYEMADEMGIMLWSEFQFSDAQYPTTHVFEQEYATEAAYQVRRVNHHPSLALWAGGNELESIQLNQFYNATHPGQIQKDYEHTFGEVLIKSVYENTRSISYIPSSTYNGYLKLDFDSDMPQKFRWDTRLSEDEIFGDTDMYNYDFTQSFNFSIYPVGRFAAEFGFISMSSLESWQSIGLASPSFDDDVVVHHNRHLAPFDGDWNDGRPSKAGLAQMTGAVPYWYPKPDLPDPVANFSSWIWTTQVFQADFYRHQIAFYRRGSGLPERQLGSLYWQLDDQWVGSTWATVESNNKPKMAYYGVKDMYEHVIVSPYYDVTSGNWQVWVTSDLLTPFEGEVEMRHTDWAGNELKLNAPKAGEESFANLAREGIKKSIMVDKLGSTRVISIDHALEDLIKQGGDPANAVGRLSVKGTANGQPYSHYIYSHPVSLAKSKLQNPGLTVTPNFAPTVPTSGSRSHAQVGWSADGRSHTQGTVSFTVTAPDAIAAWVYLDVSSSQVQGYWSDNAFWLGKGESRSVEFHVWEDWTGDGSWAQGVTVRSMYDNIAQREYAARVE